MKKHYKLIVSGRVQGVGYRFSCSEMAHLLDIKGFVKNKRNGNVYIEAEGEENDLVEFISWCRQGPSWAKVIDIDIKEDIPVDYESFQINRA